MVPDDPKFDWVKQYPASRSVTELEIQQALRNSSIKPLFYFRDPSFEAELPPTVKDDFVDSIENRKKIVQLKEQLKAHGQKIYVYKPVWGAVKDGKPLLVGQGLRSHS